MKIKFVQAVCVFAYSLIIATQSYAEDAPGFLLVNATVTDFQKLGVYGQALPDVYAKYKGEYVIFGGIGRNVEVFTGTAGKFVSLEKTIQGFKEIINGDYDELPEGAFYMVGDIEDVNEKAASMVA